jgi:cation/acetate symporter
MLLAMAFKGQNVAFMVGLAFAIAASANFPALILSLMWKKFSTQAAVWSIYIGMISAVTFIVLSPTVYVDIIHKADKEAITKQVGEIDGKVKAIDAEIESLTKQVVPADAIAAIKKKKDAAAAMQKNAELQASIDGKKKDKDALAAQKKDASAKMPVAPIKYRNPGIFSMGLAFAVGILFSFLFPEKDAEEKFATEKLREYVGIGAE